MLTEFEIKALEHNLLDYNAWGDHAVESGIYQDKETSLKDKAKKCALRLIRSIEANNGPLTTSYEVQRDSKKIQLNTFKSDFETFFESERAKINIKNSELNKLKPGSKKYTDKMNELMDDKNTFDTIIATKVQEHNVIISEIKEFEDKSMWAKVQFITEFPTYKNRKERKSAIE